MSVSNLIASGLYSKLSGGTALITLLGGTAIYRDLAPKDIAYPYVVFRPLAGGPDNMTPSDSRTLIYSVIAYAHDKGQAGSIDASVSSLLHRQAITVTGYTNYWLARETEINLVEQPPDAEIVFASGAQYRIRLD